MQQLTLAFLGGGHLTKSLLTGLQQSNFDLTRVWVTDRHKEKLAHLKNQFSVHIETSNAKATQLADILILAVKPQDMPALIVEIKEIVEVKKPFLISMAAGIQTQRLEYWLDTTLAIVRAMPNAPALLCAGATGLYANPRVSDSQRDQAESLLRAVGITVWLNHEHDLDVVTALSGSGPAYFFSVMQALQQGAENLGLPSRVARLLTLQTALGAARMAIESEMTLTELTQHITSPGGTTEKALEVLACGKVQEWLEKALKAARDRAQEMNHLFEKNDLN